ncbi:MAG: hypothetical protein A2306_10570 [Omnitrophica WOR_2 bacterium RIFOXYB2_FULL_38_16]|nr:MAG: hypothetical protein A2267_06600 [Omnitrophica WOR_2 bacterium RIFOXYA12_FULL_38_10]OGX57802.1 MAG: hypothetical protein A2447_06895 [Omnitrophica WOR_2 bacterium RIFOXYC2_FULL_38_12]OGX58562.1 MAG: hypothetical protein A2306_10570 [Omnitrophica WOR_2 bacterium RIFOXYB2_FULL_38_16]HBG62472.1 hypothetical protein [Candidatus Omnitrophota bacterium]
MYKCDKLKNGIRIVTHDMKQRDSIAIGLWVGVGGRYESDQLKGAAHYLEHMLFKGSKKYSCNQIKEMIEGVGGALNAFTSEEQTCYYAKIPAIHLERTFDILADMVFHPKISSKDVQKEKTVILEEIKMYQDLPQYRVLEILDSLLWPDHPLGKSLAGTPESVSAMNSRMIKKFHEDYYTTKNIVVSACGDLKHSNIVNLAHKKLSSVCLGEKSSFVKVGPSKLGSSVVFFKKDIEQMHVALGAIGYDEGNKDKYPLALLSVVLGGNMSSRLFNEVREKRGLAYSIGCSSRTLHDSGVFLVRAGVDNTKIEEALSVILRELEKVVKNGVTQGEFVRAKDYLLGQLLLGMEDTMEHMLWIGEGLIARNKTKTLKSVINEFESIEKEDLKRVAKQVLKQECFRLAVVGPVTDKQRSIISRLMKTA